MGHNQDKLKHAPRDVGDIDLLDSENSFYVNWILFAQNRNRWKYTGIGYKLEYYVTVYIVVDNIIQFFNKIHIHKITTKRNLMKSNILI